jgi:hypothetical protein
MQKDLKWTDKEIDELGPTLRSHVLSKPKQKLIRVFDQATLKYKMIVDNSEKKNCHQCKRIFIGKNPKRIFCSDICRIEYHKKLNSEKQKSEITKQNMRIKKLWEC